MAGWKIESIQAGNSKIVKTSKGILHSLTISYTNAANQTVSVFDNNDGGSSNKIADLWFQAAGTAGQTVDTDPLILNWEMTEGIYIDASSLGTGGYVVAAYK